MVKKSIYIVIIIIIIIFLNHFFFKLSQKIDLNMSKYAEFHGDHVFLDQMSPNIAQVSIFISFQKNRIFHIFCIFKKSRGGHWMSGPGLRMCMERPCVERNPQEPAELLSGRRGRSVAATTEGPWPPSVDRQ